MTTLTLRNRQRSRAVETRRLRPLMRTLLRELLHLESFDLGFYLVAAPEMTWLNETFLHHQGSTDVIAFDYVESRPSSTTNQGRVASQPTPRSDAPAPPLCGEIFVCVDEAIVQARRFHTTWQCEVVRYIVHGVLHLRGYDDQSVSARRRMKREEARLLRQLAARFGPNYSLRAIRTLRARRNALEPARHRA